MQAQHFRLQIKLTSKRVSGKFFVSARGVGGGVRPGASSPRNTAQEFRPAHEVGDSAPAAARFTGSPYSRSFSPGLRLRLHPGLYAAACSAGSRHAFQKCSNRSRAHGEQCVCDALPAMSRRHVQFPGFASQSQIRMLRSTAPPPALNSQPSTMIQLNQERSRQCACGLSFALQRV